MSVPFVSATVFLVMRFAAFPIIKSRSKTGPRVMHTLAAAGLSQAYIAQIETGKREGRIDTYRSIASILKVNIDGLV